MPVQTTPRDRWLALALLLAVLVLAYLLLVHPFFTVPWRAIDQEIVALQERQHRVQVQIDQRPEVSARLQQVQQALRERPGFLPEATAEAAAAALSSRVQDAVLSASPGNRGCVVSNRTPMPDNRTEASYVRVALQVRLRCGVDETASVLHALETGAPRLFVENLNMLAQRFQQSTEEAGTGLDVSFELIGYLQPGIADAGAAPGSMGDDEAAAAATEAAPAPATAEVDAADSPPADVEQTDAE
ncbi:general secretion pathway protein GspM [Stenotrophomonas sp. Betaine-02u-21]|uniref:type II secretion system protein GspM n=1 Tax=unclassified Stenotrophomonas TaxID=196198 RepID=UPI000C3318A6|nr:MULTISPECIES: type II secretion system protein GspM [unclassified Stenotrophomonas]PKH70010.1 general secretion pathway protein GspM [Stenotrophomonas sp. Betaine-02u-23]PKH75930.1 general secretion pathway protein GspM [Stenotrophomonas sp. Betaine-02u-21]PKH95345.1 general secretion pathway protein GspM [Stenotrophomonas sp. Bg11-02]